MTPYRITVILHNFLVKKNHKSSLDRKEIRNWCSSIETNDKDSSFNSFFPYSKNCGIWHMPITREAERILCWEEYVKRSARDDHKCAEYFRYIMLYVIFKNELTFSFWIKWLDLFFWGKKCSTSDHKQSRWNTDEWWVEHVWLYIPRKSLLDESAIIYGICYLILNNWDSFFLPQRFYIRYYKQQFIIQYNVTNSSNRIISF